MRVLLTRSKITSICEGFDFFFVDCRKILIYAVAIVETRCFSINIVDSQGYGVKWLSVMARRRVVLLEKSMLHARIAQVCS